MPAPASSNRIAARGLVALALLLVLLPAMQAFITAVRPRAPLAKQCPAQAPRLLTHRLGATASFIPGGEGSSSGNGPLASVPSIESLEELERLTQATGDRPLVLRYHASWCSACKKFQPSWLEAAGAYSGFDFMDVDVTNHRDIIKAMGLTVLPHCHIYRQGKQIESIPVSVKKLNNLLDKLEALKTQAS